MIAEAEDSTKWFVFVAFLVIAILSGLLLWKREAHERFWTRIWPVPNQDPSYRTLVYVAGPTLGIVLGVLGMIGALMSR